MAGYRVSGLRRRPNLPPWLRRGTLRVPGADLRKLPVGLDFGNISVAEGLRAAVASGAVLVVNIWLQSPALLLVAFAANLTCFCDTGGALRDRIPALVGFTLIGAAVWSGFGLLHGFGLPILLPAAALVIFCNSMARVWGVRAQAVGNVMTVVLALAVDRALTLPEAAVLFVSFLAGGLWAILLTIGIWRIYPDRAVTRLIAANWRLLARFSRDLVPLLATGSGRLELWEAHARGHRRAVRDALEESRTALLDATRPPGPVSVVAARNLLTVESQDRIFGALVALSDMLEYAEDPALRAAAARLLRRLRPLLDLCGREPDILPERLEPVLGRLTASCAGHPALAEIGGILVERLRIGYRLKSEAEGLPKPLTAPRDLTLRDMVSPLRANLTWTSAILRHAVRAVVLTVVAIAISLLWWSVYAHWLTITVALTMQPYFAATWQRALERIAGTLLGALLGGALAFLPQTTIMASLLMVPLSIIGFSVRQVSYGAYVACLTPLVVILFEVAEPGHSAWMIASMRTLYTIGGGIVAVLACMVLWPSWEPDRTTQGLGEALRAHSRYAKAIFEGTTQDGSHGNIEAARRACGIASNNLEASLSRALQEPRRGQERKLEIMLAADAALRRLGGALLTLQHDSRLRGRLSDADWTAWSRSIPEALDALADGAPLSFQFETAVVGTLGRIGRVIDVLRDIMDEMPMAGSPLDASPPGGRRGGPREATRVTAGTLKPPA